MRTFRIKQLALLSIVFLIACQEDTPIIDDTQPVDEDMLAATLLADEYFMEQAEKGRRAEGERAITILKYQDGNIYFNTNTDDVDGYQIVTETTVTAHVKPGEYIFWYRGGGLEDLEDVDFDENAEAYLNQLPDEYKEDQMFVLKVPDFYDPEHDELKYDIVYECKDNKGIVIRLDPKIQVSTAHDDGNGTGEDDGDDDGNDN